MTNSPSFPLNERAKALGESVSSDQALLSFLEYLDERKLALYPAQEEAIMYLYQGENVILNTPTGSGKSLVALALHFIAVCQKRKSFYTAPIKALVNEKFLDLCREFGPESVGLVTGDASVNAEAPIVCCTAEILSNLALRKGEICGVDDVIMDEFHYYSDRERGVAWQVPLLTLKETRFLLMSATLGEMSFFEREVSRLNGFATRFVSSGVRPVPLSYTYQSTPLQETIQQLVGQNRAPLYLVSFSQRQAADEAQNLLSVDICTKEDKKAIKEALLGVRFTSPYGKEIQKLLLHGIGIHHAGLLPRYRLAVEGLAQKGLLKVISGTDTLGVGVNVPIRTVVFTQLCKFDGEKTAIVSARDFHQISGRAGRKGFDDLGYVVAQAPEHVIENLKLEAKAGGDPKKVRKIVKRKPPEKGFVLWTQETFEKLISSKPEPLVSKFSVSHGLVLSVLSRENGCAALKALIRNSHETVISKQRHVRLSFQIFRSLVERGIIQFQSISKNHQKSLILNVDLQQDFSLHQTLSLFLIDTLSHLDRESSDYALDVLTLCESIVENPEVILRRQLDKVKTEKMFQMKQDGVEFEERMAELEKLEYPKPRRDFIYDRFNEFAAAHPWVGQENIRPKSIAREMVERIMPFSEYIKEYGLERSEGVLLRTLSEVYRVLVKTVPVGFKTQEVDDIVDFLGGVLRQIDSTLLDEWERMKTGGVDPLSSQRVAATQELPQPEVDITKRSREFEILIRNEVFQYVKALLSPNPERFVELVKASDGGSVWTFEKLAEFYRAYVTCRRGPVLADTRNPLNTKIDRLSLATENIWKVEQKLCDEEGENDWTMNFELDLSMSKEAQSPVLKFVALETL